MLEYIRSILTSTPLLKELIVRDTSDAIDLKKSIRIDVKTASFRAIRGDTAVAILCDEVAFWRSDNSANPDGEILNALRPTMLTIPDSILVCASLPYEKSGVLYDNFCRYFGKREASVLVWKAPTLEMNPTVDQNFLAEEFEKDPVRARSEYGAEFRPDRATALFAEKGVRACVVDGRYELAPDSRFDYIAFVDPSGGSHDAMTLAIAHWEDGVVVIDCLRERRSPCSPDAAVREFAETISRYRLHEATGDRYGASFFSELFAQNGVSYDISKKSKTDLYLDLVPRINSGKIELLDDHALVTQLLALERKPTTSGRESIDHPRGQLDDLANAVAGVATMNREPAKIFF